MNKLLLIIILFLFGCKAKEVNWSYECSNRFPTKTVYIPGKDTTLWDTIREAGLIIQSDPIIRFKKCPDNLIIKGKTIRVDTLRTPDKAKEAYLQSQINIYKNYYDDCYKSSLDALKLAKEANDNDRKHIKQRNWLFILSCGLLIFSFRKKILSLMKLFI